MPLLSDDIKAFYDVKEAFMALDDIDEKSAAEHDLEKELDEIIKRFHQLGTKEGVSISKTLKSWKREYLNSFGSSFYDHVPLADETTKIARVTQLHILEDLKPFNSVFASVARKYDISRPRSSASLMRTLRAW